MQPVGKPVKQLTPIVLQSPPVTNRPTDIFFIATTIICEKKFFFHALQRFKNNCCNIKHGTGM